MNLDSNTNRINELEDELENMREILVAIKTLLKAGEVSMAITLIEKVQS